ncbi:MAG: hypothetical protein V3R81_11950, partial [Gammaproteobacteria bacterium]
TEQVLADPELQRQMNKVTMRVPEYLEIDNTVHLRCPEGAGVTLTTQTQEQYGDFLDRPTGMPGNPVSDAALEDKFCDCFRHGGIPEERARRVAQRIWALETIDDLYGLLD